MLVSIRRHVPTLNGRSGKNPPNWSLRAVGYEDNSTGGSYRAISAILKSMTEHSAHWLEYFSIRGEKGFPRIVWITVGAIAFFIPLLAHAYIGLFSRFLSDEYCTAGVIQTHGFWGAQKYWFTTWTGRFSFTLAISMIHLLGSNFVPFIPGITIGIWLVALTWTVSHIARTASHNQPAVVSFFLAALIIVSTLATSPAVDQSLYWATGAVTYVVPLVLLTIYVGFLFRMAGTGNKPRLSFLILSACLTFTAGGFSETYAALQGGGLCLPF